MTILHDLYKVGKNKYIEASAGTGKTFVLSKYYCAILDDWCRNGRYSGGNHENILVLTYTNKAAAEMRERIYSDLRQLVSGRELAEMMADYPGFAPTLRSEDPDIRKANEDLLQQFGHNRIMTIDSFCGQILRSYAHHAGLDPLYRTDDGILDIMVREEVWRDLFNRGNQSSAADLQTLLSWMSERQLQAVCNFFCDHDEALISWRRRLDSMTEETLRNDFLRRWTDIPPEFAQIQENFLDLVEKMDPFRDEHDWVRQNMERFESMAQDFYQTRDQGARYRKFVADILPLFRRKTAPGDYLKSFRIAGLDSQLKSDLNAFLDYLRTTLPLELTGRCPDQADEDRFRVIYPLRRIADEFVLRVKMQREARNYLSFSDIIQKTEKLLRERQDIREELHEQYRHILVDEFQDTNDIRWNIIRMIADPRDGRRFEGLFIVGDKKQSIYRFQNADVKVMSRVRKLLNRNENQDQSEFHDLLVNFRSSSRYMNEVINPLFSCLMAEAPERIADYETSFITGQVRAASESDPSGKALHFHIDHSGDDPAAEVRNCITAVREALAWCHENGITQPEGGGPLVAVLLPTFTKIAEYQQLFREAGLSYSVVSGKGFWSGQEVRDIFHLLGVLLNPGDDMSLIGLLRSPLLLCSDSEIQELMTTDPELRLVDRIRRSEKIRDVGERLARWLALRDEKPLHEVLTDIFSETEFELGYIAEINGRQRLENLEKLRLILLEQSLQGKSTAELHAFMEERMLYDKDSAQAEIPGRHEVQIMTIHKSKGLQFPVVVLPSLQGRWKRNGNSIGLYDREGESDLFFPLEPVKGRQIPSRLFDSLKAQVTAEEDAERLRLLYVALTRAKYRSHILLRFDGKKPYRDSWYGRFFHETVFGLEGTEKADFEGLAERFPNYEFHFSVSDADARDKVDDGPDVVLPWRSWSPPEFPVFPRRSLTPHDLMEGAARTGLSSDSTVSDDFGRQFGILFHKVMEKGWWQTFSLSSDAESWLRKSFPSSLQRRMITELERQLEILRDSPLAPVLLSLDPRHVYNELPLSGQIENENETFDVQGVADLLYYSEGRWVVLDFKSDSGMQNLDAYRIQIRAYQWLLKTAFGLVCDGQIYFSALGELVSVASSDPSTEDLFGPGFHVCYPACSARDEALFAPLREGGENPVLILHPTREAARECSLKMSGAGLNHPRIIHRTFAQFLLAESEDRKRLTPLSSELLTRAALEEGNIAFRPGAVQLLSEALIQAEEEDRELLPEGQEILPGYQARKAALELFNDRELARAIRFEDYGNFTVILNGFWQTKSRDRIIVQGLMASARAFHYCGENPPYMTDDLNTIPLSPDWKPAENMVFNPPLPYRLFANPAEELEAIAEDILSEVRRDPRIPLRLIIADFTAYLPVVRRVLENFGIPWYSPRNPNLLVHPLGILFRQVSELLSAGTAISWITIKSVFSSSLLNNPMDLDALDIFVRARSLKTWRDVSYAAGREDAEARVRQSVLRITRRLDALGVAGSGSPFRLADRLRQFAADQLNTRKLQAIDEGEAVLLSILEIIDLIAEQIRLTGVEGPPRLFSDLLISELRSGEYRNSALRAGVEVTSLLNSAALPGGKTWICGVNNGAVPPLPRGNLFLKNENRSHILLNYRMLKALAAPGQFCRLSCCRENMAGAALDISPFLLTGRGNRSFERQQISRMDRIYAARGRRLQSEDPRLSRVIERHNHLTAGDRSHPFSGLCETGVPAALNLSAKRLNQILACRQKYWYGNVLHLQNPQEQVTQQASTIIGKMVHDLLDVFAKRGGYDLDTLAEAEVLMSGCISEKESQLPEALLNEAVFRRNWRQYCSRDGQKGLIFKLLELHFSNFREFHFMDSEWTFGTDPRLPVPALGPDVSINGTLDKMLENQALGIVYVGDIKTGKCRLPDLPQANLEGQLLLYYLALKSILPKDKKIILAYEQIKSFRSGETRITKFLGDRCSYTEKGIILDDPDSETAIDKYVEAWARDMDRLRDGDFSLTEKAVKDACAYCPYDAICRRDSLLLPLEDDENADD